MIGFPRVLTTRFDYDYIRANFQPDEWRPAFQKLLDGEYTWQMTGELVAGDAGITDETHRVETSERDGVTNRYQFVYTVDLSCAMLRAGLTRDEVMKMLAG